MNQTPVHEIRITHIGGPTTLIEIGSLCILTDPTFEAAGFHYTRGAIKSLKKTSPAIAISELRPIDVVLLSHDQHADNLDPAGRAYLSLATRTLTTPAGANRLGGNAQGIATWETTTLTATDGLQVQITATPARHGPPELEEAMGAVNGWILEWNGQRHGVLYISGDTVLFDTLYEIPRRYEVGTALLHFGAAHFDVLGPVHLTFTAHEGVQFAQELGDSTIIPIHYEGWTHFVEGRAEIEQAFAHAGLAKRLKFLPIGQAITINV